MGYWKTQGLVILPQALKLVIPGLVNTIIALFKDTSLVIIIGLFDLFSSVQQATVDPTWLGMSTEGARMVQTNDKVIIMAYADVTPEEAKQQKTGRCVCG